MKKWNNKLFTILELLLVIAVIVILASLLLPALREAREKGKEISCLSKLKQMGNAACMYSSDYNGRVLARYYDNGTNAYVFDCQQSVCALTPYLGHPAWTRGQDADSSSTLFVCPSDTAPFTFWKLKISYGVNARTEFPFPVVGSQQMPKPSGTIAYTDSKMGVAGAPGDASWWASWGTYRHRNGINILMWDTSAKNSKVTAIPYQTGGAGLYYSYPEWYGTGW